MSVIISRLLLVLLIWLVCRLPVMAARDKNLAPARERLVMVLESGWEVMADDTAISREILAVRRGGTPCTLPATWPLSDATGAIWCARDVRFPDSVNGAGVLLRVEAPIGQQEVYLDGTRITAWLGNGITREVILHGPGGSNHRLAFRLARNMQLPAAQAGLGAVTLEVLPAVRFEQVRLVFDVARKRIQVAYRLRAETPGNATVRLSLYAPGATRAVAHHTATANLDTATMDGEYVFTLKRFASWSPRLSPAPGEQTLPSYRPQLYRLRAEVSTADAGDVREITGGACAVTLVNSQFYINGFPTSLKGMRLPGGMPAASANTLCGTEMEQLHRAGYNIIQAEGAALSDEMLDAADQTGMLVIGEIPIAEDGQPELSAITAFGQHPSIIGWSWHNAGMTSIAPETLRALDVTRPFIIRRGTESLLVPPAAGAATPFIDLDATLTVPVSDDWWAQVRTAEARHLPVLVSGIGFPPEVNSEAAYAELQRVVARLRLSQKYNLIGYFIRPLAPETLTGVCTPSGVPTSAFTTALAYNNPLALILDIPETVKVGAPPALISAMINDSHLTGSYQLFLVVTEWDGRTRITSRTLKLEGQRVYDNIASGLTLEIPHAGEYRAQLLLTNKLEVRAATRVVVFTAE